MLRRAVLSLLAAGALVAPIAAAQYDMPDAAPEITGLKVSPTVFPRRANGTRIRFRLSEAATVAFTFERLSSRKKVPGTFLRELEAGRQALRFDGKVGGRALPYGRYRMTAVATDALGAASEPVRVELQPVIPAIYRAIESCKRSIDSVSDLSEDTKQDLKRICVKAATGKIEDVEKVTERVCRRIVKASIPKKAPRKVRRQALRACDTSGS